MAEQLGRRVDREALRAARSLARSPKHDEPRKKVVEVEGERVTCREASIVLRVNGECRMVPPGSVAVARVHGSCINLGALIPMLDRITSLQPLRDSTEEPCAGIPHAGICEGTVR
jgi:hypothetical protein